MRRFLDRLAREPAALGTLFSSVLPAMVVLGIVAMDAETIGVLVVAVNAISGFAIRMLVAPNAAVATVPAAVAAVPAAVAAVPATADA
jgi:hypothetical protein